MRAHVHMGAPRRAPPGEGEVHMHMGMGAQHAHPGMRDAHARAAHLEGEMLELILRGCGLGLHLERCDERQPALLLDEVQPEGEGLGVGELEEQRR